MAIRNYTTFDLIRFKNFANVNNKLSSVELIKAYNETYPEKTPKEKLINLSKALGINNLHKALTGNNIPDNERLETPDEDESVLPISDVSGCTFDKIKELINKDKPVFNKGKCKDGCNCIEIAEYNNGGEPVKNYECLGG